MNALHLLWIVPFAALFGFAIAAALNAAKDDEADYKHLEALRRFYWKGYEEGKSEASKSLTTAQSELRLSEHITFTADDVIERGKNFVIRQLGEAVYPYAKHFITKDGVYIASVEVLK